MVEFPYRQRVGWIFTYQSIVPCLSLLWAGQGVGRGPEKIFSISTSLVLAQIQTVGALGQYFGIILSTLLAVSLLILSDAIPASRCRLLVLVGLRQPVMVQQA